MQRGPNLQNAFGNNLAWLNMHNLERVIDPMTKWKLS